jgi:AMMECR1 domain-containing protein
MRISPPVLFCLVLLGIICASGSHRLGANEQSVWANQLRTPKVQKAALDLSRRAMTQYLRDRTTLRLPADLPSPLRKRGAVFVTVEKQGRITPRGCRGTLDPITPSLAHEIVRNSIAACIRDANEPPLRANELPHCLISLTVVLRTSPITSITQHDAAENGLIALSGSQMGIVLPYEGRDAQTKLLWARRKAGVGDKTPVQLLELFAIRFREE